MMATPATVDPGAPVDAVTSAERASDEGTVAPDSGEVDDAMLLPMARASHVIRDWDHAVELMRERSTAVATKRAQVAGAKALTRGVLAKSLPTIYAEGELRRSLIRGTGFGITNEGATRDVLLPQRPTFWRGSVSLRQPVLDVQSWTELETSRIAERVARLDHADSKRIVLAELAETLLSVMTAERIGEISRESLRSNLATVQMMERRTELGVGGDVDVLLAEQEVSRSRSDILQADEGVRRSREALGLTLGDPQEWGVPPDLQVDGILKDLRQLCSTVSSATERSDVRSAQTALDVAAREAKTARYGWIPRLDVVSDFDATNRIFTVNGRAIQWTVGAILQVPIYDGGRIGAERHERAARESIAREKLTDVRRRAQLEAAQVRRAAKVAESDYALGVEFRNLAQATLDAARTAFGHGTATGLELLDASRAWKQAELELAIREFALVSARLSAVLVLSNCHFDADKGE